ncbi:MAG: hypothetical protein ACLGHP_07050, partial [Vicinamibacteria bacterium]
MRDLVHECADLSVGGPGGNDDLVAVWVTPPTRPRVGEVADLDVVAKLSRQGDERRDQVAVAVTLDRLGRRRHRDRRLAG